MGGLSGKAFQIEKRKNKNGLPHLVVDAGNLLFKQNSSSSKTAAEMLTAETIQQAYRTMGYDAVAVSRSDLSAGELFFENSKDSNFTWVSANIFDTSGKLIFKPFIIKKFEKISVGVIGLTGPGTFENDKAVIDGWQEPLRLQLRDLASRTDMIILLSNFPSSENSIIAETFPELNIVLTADENQRNVAPSIAGNAVITQTQAKGKYLGKLSMEFHSGGKWFEGIQAIQNQKSFDTEKPVMINRFKSEFIAIRPKSPQSQQINLMVEELKRKIDGLKRQ